MLQLFCPKYCIQTLRVYSTGQRVQCVHYYDFMNDIIVGEKTLDFVKNVDIVAVFVRA